MVVVGGGGGGVVVTVKLPLDVALPPGVVTVMGPFVAPCGTTAVSCVAETTVKLLIVGADQPSTPVRLSCRKARNTRHLCHPSSR